MWNEVFGVKEQELAERIVRYVKDEVADGHIPQPMFIVGPSGSGKSAILNVLYSRLEEDQRAAGRYLIDGKRLFCSDDIINTIDKIDTNEEKGLNEKENGSRKIVLIDNLDYYFNRTSFEDQYVLRRYLNQEKAPLLIATISEISDYLADYRAPFFEGIRIMYVPKFDGSSLEEMEIPKEMAERLSILMNLLPPVVRSFNIASEIVSQSDDGGNDVDYLLERFGVEYRTMFENMPVNSQRILTVLSISDIPMSLSELRTPTGLQSGILSSYLRQLLKSGVIRKVNPEKHGAPYEICDKLFKLWLTPGVNHLISDGSLSTAST